MEKVYSSIAAGVGRRARNVRNRARDVLIDLGFDLYQKTDDRLILQDVIFPWFRERGEFRRIVFLGCEWYTKGYRSKFQEKDYWTLEIDPKKRKYGAAQHIVDSATNLSSHFEKESVDLIVCNGVYGWGLNRKSDMEQMLAGSFASLRPGGVFILGWNDIPERRPFPLEQFEGLHLFRPYEFPPLHTAEFLTASRNRHTYNFYSKGERRP